MDWQPQDMRARLLGAWSTRRALSGNYGTESDPLMRPFAHSGTVYAATQVTPLLMDMIGKRAMVSRTHVGTAVVVGAAKRGRDAVVYHGGA